MAPTDGTPYLPSLGLCLEGKQQMISWKLLYTGIANENFDPGTNGLKAFLECQQTQEALWSCMEQHGSTSTNSQAEFDSYPAAINVSHNDNERYNLQQIKHDAVWLSKLVGIELITALRYSVLEWQSRPVTRLEDLRLEEESPGSLKDSKLYVSISASRAKSLGSKENADRPGFDTELARHVRLLQLWMEECQYQYKCLEHTISCSVEGGVGSLTDDLPTVGGNRGAFDIAIKETGKAILQHIVARKTDDGRVGAWVGPLVALLRSKVHQIYQGSGSFKEEGPFEAIERKWTLMQATEAVLLMRTAIHILQCSAELPSASDVNSWFSFVADNNFFEEFETPLLGSDEASSYCLRSLATLTSLAILKVPSALETLPHLANSSAASDDEDVGYLQNLRTIENTSQVLITAALRSLTASQPVALVWSILMQAVRAKALLSQESRDSRQSQSAIENMSQSQVSDSDSNDTSHKRTRPSMDRGTSFGSDTSQHSNLLESIIDCVQRVDGPEDIIESLARSAFSGPGAFATISDLATTFCPYFDSERQGLSSCRLRVILLDIVEIALDYIDYGSDLVSTVLAILSGGRSRREKLEASPYLASSQPASVLLRSSVLRTKILDQAGLRFPFELAPFLELCTALMEIPSTDPMGSYALELLSAPSSYTTLISDDEYALLPDDADQLTLTKTLSVDWSPASLHLNAVPALPASEFQNGANNVKMTPKIRQGSNGYMLTESKPVVARFDFTFSGYRYMGRILQRALNTYFGVDKSNIGAILEPVVDIITLLVAVLDAAAKESAEGIKPADYVDSILEDFSDGLDDGIDIVAVIFSILDYELQEQHATTLQGDPTEVLVACINFMHALLPLQPSRVWPFLSRSGLLGLDGVESRLLSIIATREVPTGRFPFLFGSIQLFEGLVNDVVRHSATRRKGSSAVATRFGEPARDNLGAGIRDAIMAKILHTFTKVMIDVYESAKGWRTATADEIPRIYSLISHVLNEVLKYSFDVDDRPHLTEKLTAVLAPAAEYITDVLLLNTQNSVALEPLLQSLRGDARFAETALDTKGERSLTHMAVNIMKLVEHLIRIRAYLRHGQSHLEKLLFIRADLLVQAFASKEGFRLPVIRLLHALMVGSDQDQDQPSSLLGHLGQVVALNFLELLARVGEPLSNLDLSTGIWRLLSAVVTNQQQWLALLLLSGETAREYLRKKDEKKAARFQIPSLLEVALNKLRHLEAIDPREAVNILEFVCVAADHWPWVSRKIQGNTALIKEFTSLITRLDEQHPVNAVATSPLRALKLQMAGFITKILAIIVYRGNEAKESDFAEQIAPHLQHFAVEGSSTLSYNASLHLSLQKNFSAKYSNCKLSSFKRTAVSWSQLGPDYYYDIGFADKVFGLDRSWSRGDGRSFADEFARANVNLSYVQAQINLFNAWKTLAGEIALAIGDEKAVQEQMVKLIRVSLEANQELALPEQIFGKLAYSRAELAFVLLQDLLKHSSKTDEAQTLVAPAWTLIQSHAPDLGVALAGPDADYDRVLLKILYLSLQLYASTSLSNSNGAAANSRKLSPNMTAAILDILGNCVAKGFRSLVSLLHEEPSRVLPVDLAVLNAILHTCLQIPDIDRQTEQLVAYFADGNTTHYATALFSWADRLLVDGDPVYGSLSIAFLLELSTVPCLAECVILGGSLGQLSSSNLAACLMRPGGTGPFDKPGRVHTIWSRGLLPLTINLLRAIGAPVAADIAAFLNQFKGQMERAVNAVAPKAARGPANENNKYITLTVASEIHSLAILSAILDALREAGSGAGLAPGEVPPLAIEKILLRGDVETLLQRRNVLRDEIVATDAREESWSRRSPSSSQSLCDNLLEEKIVQEFTSALEVLSESE